jgi:hypothetical protein
LDWIDLYPINPHSLASFRQTFFSSRAKDNPLDSQLLEELVRTHSDRSRWADATDIQKYSGTAPVIERSGKSVWVHRRFPDLNSSGKPSMSLPSKACNILHGPISFMSVNATAANPITVPLSAKSLRPATG